MKGYRTNGSNLGVPERVKGRRVSSMKGYRTNGSNLIFTSPLPTSAHTPQ